MEFAVYQFLHSRWFCRFCIQNSVLRSELAQVLPSNAVASLQVGKAGKVHNRGWKMTCFQRDLSMEKSPNLCLKNVEKLIWGFPKMRVPPNGWFIRENPI